jgi:hypothetical protein
MREACVLDESNLYYKTIKKELADWEKDMTRRPGFANRTSKKLQTRIHKLVPQKAQDVITAAIKTTVETILTGSAMLTITKQNQNPALAESDYLADKAYDTYHKVALAQGIGFGLGGFLINLADIPAMLSYKVKFLFDCCKLYGFDPDQKAERLFMLHIFQLAFSCDEKRAEIFNFMQNWDANVQEMDIDWQTLQIEYRDYLDIAKLLQLLPVVGAAAGAAANHNLMKKLKITAMNAYRMRILGHLERSARMCQKKRC